MQKNIVNERDNGMKIKAIDKDNYLGQKKSAYSC